MSGHSKWAGIKHKKAIVDAKKGKTWTKIANMIAVAVKEGGSDQSANFRLRLAIEKAKEANMPKDNVDRAIKRGRGELKGFNIEEIRYEGYGPVGVAVMVGTATDNRNRTALEVRAVFSKYNGKLALAGSVSWMFVQKGHILVHINGTHKDEAILKAIDLGAKDVEESGDDQLVIYTEPFNLESMRKTLEEGGIKIDSSEIFWIPKNEVKVEDEKTANQILKLIDSLKDIDDVTDVVANFNIADELMEKLG